MTLFEMVMLWATIGNLVLLFSIAISMDKIHASLERQWIENLQRELRRFQ
jgi:hypothetical protein